MLKKLMVAAAVLAISATPALAKSGGNGGNGGHAHNNGSTVASSIVLNEANPALGDMVTFTTDAEGLSGNEWPMVSLMCYQGDLVVYGALNAPTAGFVLGGGSSLWLQLGGPADCQADLDAYGTKGGMETIRTLASTSFSAAG